MSFMEPQVQFGKWYRCDTDDGVEYVPEDVTKPDKLPLYVEGKLQSFELIEGYGARMSAPGYLDCTDWCVFSTEEEAVEFLAETFGEELEEKL